MRIFWTMKVATVLDSSLPISIELRSLFPMLPLGFVYCTLFQFAQVPALFWQAAASVPILVCE